MSPTEKSRSKLILLMSASLDGFLAREAGVIDWLSEEGESPEAGRARHQGNLELLMRAEQIVLGRGAYDEMAGAWSGSDSPMAQRINAMPKVVFSTSDPEFEWENSRRAGGSLADEIGELKAEEGDVVCFGGARFAHALARAQLIDEYRLTVHPVALGAGLPLWHGLPEPQRFAPISATAYPDGTVVHALVAKN